MKIIECPRDAMQGIKKFIPTEVKINYINQLLKVGFDTLDVGSFVSPKAIPQMRDTGEVLDKINYKANHKTKLLTIVANERGAEDACSYKQITYLGFPFSISPTFQQRNTNSGLKESFNRVKNIQELCDKHQKELVVYISMAFGNPYGDLWNHHIATEWLGRISELGVKVFSLADTIGVATPDSVHYIFSKCAAEFPELEIGVHLHTTKTNWKAKVDAAYEGGCLRFDAAMRGFGGCPMAKDELVGNLATEDFVYYFEHLGIPTRLKSKELEKALELSQTVFDDLVNH